MHVPCWEAIGSNALNAFELVSVLAFTFEYSANVWSAPANRRHPLLSLLLLLLLF